MKYNECHGHIAFGPGTDEEKMKALKKAGIVYYRDGGDAQGLGAKLKYEMKDYGVKFVTPVYAIYKEGLYGKILGQPFESIKDFRLALKVSKYAGADFAKLILSGIASFKEPGKLSCDGVCEEEIKEMVKICHGEGFAVMAHCNGAETIKYAIEAGVDSLEHGIFIDEEGIKMLSESETVWVPTITAITNDDIQRQHRLSVEKAVLTGVKVACGSDSGAGGSSHGNCTREEYKALLSCGAEDALITRSDEIIKTKFRLK